MSDPDIQNKNNIKEEDFKWYVVNVYSGHEKKVAQLIKQRVDTAQMTDLVSEIIVPTQNKVVISEGKRKTIEDRILPGYIIIKMVLDKNTWPLIKDTQGVTGFTGTNKQPTPLSPAEVKAILRFMSIEQPAYQTSLNLGDAVTITEGPFKDFPGSISKIDEQKGKVEVLITVFGREAPISVDLMQISKI